MRGRQGFGGGLSDWRMTRPWRCSLPTATMSPALQSSINCNISVAWVHSHYLTSPTQVLSKIPLKFLRASLAARPSFLTITLCLDTVLSVLI